MFRRWRTARSRWSKIKEVLRSVFCLGRNVTVRPPGYLLGYEESDVEAEAFPPSLHDRPEGGPAEASPGRQGSGLDDLRRDPTPAVGVLRLVAPGMQQPRSGAGTGGLRRGEQAREGTRRQEPRVRGQAGEEGQRDRRADRRAGEVKKELGEL